VYASQGEPHRIQGGDVEFPRVGSSEVDGRSPMTEEAAQERRAQPRAPPSLR
jgi:hypothetical protein